MQKRPRETQNIGPRVSEFALDRLHVGECTEREANALQGLLQEAPLSKRLQERTETFSQLHRRPDFAALLQKEQARHQALGATSTNPPPEKTTKAPLTRLSELLSAWWGQAWMPMVLIGAAALLVMQASPEVKYLSNETNQLSAPLLRAQKAKGSTVQAGDVMFRALYFRKGAPYPKWLQKEAVLYGGDLLQFSYVAATPKHIMVVGLNDQGKPFPVIPGEGNDSQPIQAGIGKLPPNDSLELDDYVGAERYFFFASDRPFTYTQVKQAIALQFAKSRRVQGLTNVPGPWQMISLLIQKQRAPLAQRRRRTP